MAIPGGIVSMVGVVLSVQAATGLWATWAYAWALVAPGGVGLAFVLYGILTGQSDIAREGVPILLTGLGLFVAFGLFFEGVLHLSGAALPLAEPVLAAGLVVLGVVIVFVGLTARRARS
jgi:hydrogenase/urease accessory protein HupE